MKPTRILLILPLLFFGCSEPTVDGSKLVERAGIQYLISKHETSDNPYSGKFASYFDNGVLQNKGTYKEGKQHGTWDFYHENGQFMFKGTYKDGKKDGPWEWYDKNGDLQKVETYKDGKLTE